jgi:hypothetical protein
MKSTGLKIHAIVAAVALAATCLLCLAGEAGSGETEGSEAARMRCCAKKMSEIALR